MMKTDTNYGLGIDTGGTYTDAAIVNLSDKRVVTKAKSPTTHHDLRLGIQNAVDAAVTTDVSIVEKIRLVGVSTTLATNSILEGKGGKVGLIGIGWKPRDDWVLGEDRGTYIKGGHEVNGREKEPLDMSELDAAINEVCSGVDAVAVSSLFSVCNPSHENRVRKLIKERFDLPVVCGHELTGELGIKERTVTAVLNARLIPILDTFLDSVKSSLREIGIEAPIMVFKGDGSLMSIEMARERPVETILSGPAASAMGGRILAGVEDCIIIDIGGTSTDIAVLDGGFPKINTEGATVGEWRTRVRAVDMWTTAMGGDSEIVVDRTGNIQIGPERVIPLSQAAVKYDNFLERMNKHNAIKFWTAYPRHPNNLSEEEQRIFQYLAENGPCTLDQIKQGAGVILVNRFLNRLKEKNLIVGIGLTPTDLLHVNGGYQCGDIGAAEFGVKWASGVLRIDEKRFIAKVLNKIYSRIAKEVIRKIALDESATLLSEESHDYLLSTATGERPHELLEVKMKVTRPIVGIGAPVRAYLNELEKRLGTDVIIPEEHEVGNAVGAVCSPIVEVAEAVVFPGEEKCTIYSPFSVPLTYTHLEQAVEAARSLVRKHALERAERAGAQNVSVKVDVDYKKFVGGWLIEGELINRIEVRGRAIGYPALG